MVYFKYSIPKLTMKFITATLVCAKGGWTVSHPSIKVSKCASFSVPAARSKLVMLNTRTSHLYLPCKVLAFWMARLLVNWWSQRAHSSGQMCIRLRCIWLHICKPCRNVSGDRCPSSCTSHQTYKTHQGVDRGTHLSLDMQTHACNLWSCPTIKLLPNAPSKNALHT